MLLAVVQSARGRERAALASYDRALALAPDRAGTLINRGLVLHRLARYDEALASYDRALALQPDYVEALYNRAITLRRLGRYREALAAFERTLSVMPDHAHALSDVADCVQKLCDWERRPRVGAELLAHVAEGKSIVSPFVLLGYSGDPAVQLQCARKYIESKVPALPPPLGDGAPRRHGKLRIAYLSADFRRHPTAYLMAGLIEQHDRSRFEVTGASFGADDGSEIRKRIAAGCDRFLDVRQMSDQDAARLLHDLQIDIAVDLMGCTRDARPGILAHRPAPIQASYLGYLGTTGASFIDYILADEIVAPFEHQPCYTERIVHLPVCYQVNDDKRRVGVRTPSRSEAGLPEKGFVFCCFNNNWKITPELFEVWMRLLKQSPGSVLWLLRDDEGAAATLRGEAQQRGVDPARLVFARRADPAEHLARHRLAHLFLDTLPCNAGATASDALWAGLPVLTCLGTALAGRVAASLLTAAGLPELVTRALADYEAQALRLARAPALLADLKAKLIRNRRAGPLFDTARFARHIEAAYTAMWDIHRRGEAARNITISPL